MNAFVNASVSRQALGCCGQRRRAAYALQSTVLPCVRHACCCTLAVTLLSLRAQQRSTAVPMRAKLKAPVDPVKGFAFSHSAFNSTQGDIEVVSTFLPPTTVR